MEELICFDCKKILSDGDEYMTYNNVDMVKCRACHEAEPLLKNFQQTKIYSRVVGYYQAVSQYNKGKQEEFRDRRVYKIKNETPDK